MDCSSHGLSPNGTTGNWHQAGCNGSCILQKVTLASMVGKYEIQAKMTWAVMVGKYQIHAKIALASMVGKYQTGKNVQARYRGRMGAKGTGKVRAQRNGGTGKTVWGRYRSGTDW